MSTQQLARRLLACLLFVAMASCSSGPSVKSGTTTQVQGSERLAPPDSTSSVGAYTGVSEYRLGAQDLIEVSVFQVPDLNRAVRVNTSGQISLPLIGSVQAGGLTIQELEKSIAAKLEAGYLQNPQVSVFVKEYTSQRVTVEGAVKKPGIFPLSGRTSLLQAIAMAEGLDPLADLQGVVVFRQIQGKKMRAVFDIKAIRAGAVEDPQIYGDDIIVVDQSGSKTALRRVIESLPVFNLFLAY